LPFGSPLKIASKIGVSTATALTCFPSRSISPARAIPATPSLRPPARFSDTPGRRAAWLT
jgi:hypothetical protein